MQFAAGQHARRRDPFSYAALQGEGVGGSDQSDGGRSLSHEARPPAARLRCVGPFGIRETEVISIGADLETACDRHRRGGAQC